MIIKTEELTGKALDWAVAEAGGLDYETAGGIYMEDDENDEHYGCSFTTLYSPSTNWAQGGVIIEREIMTLERDFEGWFARSMYGYTTVGATPLIAAMRCYVCSKLGYTVLFGSEATK